jgi:hypothetical protein
MPAEGPDAGEATRGAKEGSKQSDPMDFDWQWENRQITPAIVDEAKKRLDARGSMEDTLRYLRDNGAMPINSIIVLRRLFNLSLKEARIILHSSETWSELRDRG